MIQYPSINVTGEPFTTNISAYPDTQSVVIYNESEYFLQITFVGSGTYGIAAYTADCFQVYSGFSGTISFNPIDYINVQNGSTPASVVFIQAYGSNETLTRLMQHNTGTGYPIALNRLQNVGNGSQVSGSASSIVNDGQAAGTSIIESTVQGDSTSSVTLSNDAQMKLGDAAHTGTITFKPLNSGFAWNDASNNYLGSMVSDSVSHNPRIDSAGSEVDFSFSGNAGIMLKVSNNGGGIQLGRTTTGDAIDQTSGAIFIKAPNGGFFFQSPNGTNRASFNAFNYGFVGGTNATVTHGLGGTPTAVLIVPVIGQPGSATSGVGNVGATTFQATVGAGSGFYWFAIR